MNSPRVWPNRSRAARRSRNSASASPAWHSPASGSGTRQRRKPGVCQTTTNARKTATVAVEVAKRTRTNSTGFTTKSGRAWPDFARRPERAQTTNERKIMHNQFDELTKALAQSITRRAALKKFGVSVALAGLLGLPMFSHASTLGPLLELSRPNAVGTCDSGFVNLPGTWTLNDAFEPFVVANPSDPKNIV